MLQSVKTISLYSLPIVATTIVLAACNVAVNDNPVGDVTTEDPSNWIPKYEQVSDTRFFTHYEDTSGHRKTKNLPYRYPTKFSEGLAAVARADGMYGYIDKFGTLQIPIKFVDAMPFHDGVAAARELREPTSILDHTTPDRKWKFIDTTGSDVTDERFENCLYSDSLGYLALEDNGGKKTWYRMVNGKVQPLTKAEVAQMDKQ